MTAVFAGETYTMTLQGEAWLAVIGIPTDFTIGDYTVDVQADGRPLAALPFTVADGGYERITLTVPQSSLDLLSDQAAIDAERATIQQAYTTFTLVRQWSGPWLRPAQGPISNPFGVLRSTNGGPYNMHTGTDIAANAGVPIVAANSGTVVLAQELYLYGNSVIVDHGLGVLTGYHHMSAIAVTAGQAVTKGDLLGYVGDTGFVSGAHLHWEARIHGVLVDPLLLLDAPLP